MRCRKELKHWVTGKKKKKHDLQLHVFCLSSWGDQRGSFFEVLFRFWRPWPLLLLCFSFRWGIWLLSLWATQVTARILSGRLGHRSTAMCFWSLQELESHSRALHFSVCWKATPLPGKWGQWGFEAETCGLWKQLEILMDSHTWVKWRHLGFVSGWEAPDCTRYGGLCEKWSWGRLGSDRALTLALCDH